MHSEPMESLPADLKTEILLRLNIKDFLSITSVNSTWRKQFFHNDEIWKLRFKMRFGSLEIKDLDEWVQKRYIEAHPETPITWILNASKWIEHYKNLDTPIKAYAKVNKTHVVHGDTVEFTLTVKNDTPEKRRVFIGRGRNIADCHEFEGGRGLFINDAGIQGCVASAYCTEYKDYFGTNPLRQFAKTGIRNFYDQFQPGESKTYTIRFQVRERKLSSQSKEQPKTNRSAYNSKRYAFELCGQLCVIGTQSGEVSFFFRVHKEHFYYEPPKTPPVIVSNPVSLTFVPSTKSP